MTTSAKDIDVYLDLDGVRKKPGPYLGVPDSDGILHITKEAIDNSIDEALADRNDTVGVVVDKDTIWVYDKGRGIPVEKHKKTKISCLTTVLTMLHAGGKMRDGKSGSYNASVGTHGMGISITNAMSENLIVYTKRDKKWYCQKFEKGKTKSKVEIVKSVKIPLLKDKPKNGTIIGFKPDLTVFDKGSKLPVDKLKDLLKNSSYLNPKVKFYYTDNKTKTKEYYEPKGLESYLSKLIKSKEVSKIGKPFIYQDKGVDVVLQWTSHTEEQIDSFVNGSKTIEGGTHLNGLHTAITNSLKNYKGKKAKFKPEDLRSGLLGAINIRIASPRFDSQTKDKLITKEVKDYVSTNLNKELTKFFNKNKSLAKGIIKRAMDVRSAHSQLLLSKKAAAELKINKRGKVLLPPKLTRAINCKDSERELFLVEGDSAGGTAKQARNKDYQEILKLKGKVLNVYKDSAKKLFQNDEVLDILKSIGFDPSKKEAAKKLRVGKIILFSDADPDGLHINVLLLSLLQKVLPEVIENGIVYVVKAGLYMINHNGKRYYGSSLKDLKNQIPSLNRDNVTRIKGWGEVGPDILAEVAFNPDTRQLLPIESVKGDELKYFEGIVGDNTDTRKKLLKLE